MFDSAQNCTPDKSRIIQKKLMLAFLTDQYLQHKSEFTLMEVYE